MGWGRGVQVGGGVVVSDTQYTDTHTQRKQRDKNGGTFSRPCCISETLAAQNSIKMGIFVTRHPCHYLLHLASYF